MSPSSSSSSSPSSSSTPGSPKEIFHKKQAGYNDKRRTVNKSYLIEPIVRHRILDSLFYKQHLYLTNESTILPIIVQQVSYIGGCDSNGKPSVFLQCLFRLLELQPSMEIIEIYLTQLNFNQFKYLTAMSLLYIRLTCGNVEIYNKFDLFIKDYRKLRMRLRSPVQNPTTHGWINYKISYMDEWVDELINNERCVDIILPRIMPRVNLVEKGLVTPRQFYIEDDNE